MKMVQSMGLIWKAVAIPNHCTVLSIVIGYAIIIIIIISILGPYLDRINRFLRVIFTKHGRVESRTVRNK